MALAFIFEGAGFGEWIVLLAVALIVFGPRRLPDAARSFGRFYAKFRRASEGFRRQLFELDNEIRRAESTVEKEAKEAFVIQGNEATAKPALEA